MANLIRAYERLTGGAIQVDQEASGVFPCDVQGGEGPDLHSKRALCDLYMRHMRTKEELPILSEEISRLKDSQEERLAYLKDQVAIIDNLLTTHETSRPGLGSPSLRYELVRPSDDVLAGLRAAFLETTAEVTRLG